MKISIAMATYNGEEYLVEQLDSLRLQTRQIDEVIICDDRSTDKTKDIILKYINDYKLGDTWKFEVNEKNLGFANNFYKAMNQTTGDLVFFCDQDDIWNPDKIQIMTDIMVQHNEIMLLCSDFAPYKSTEDAPDVPKKVLKKMKQDGSLEEIPLTYYNIYIGSLGCLMCVRKTFLNAIDKYWHDGWAHDEYVWKLAQCYEGCYNYHGNLIKRRLHSANVSIHSMHTREKRIRYLADLIKSHESTLQCAIDCKLDKRKIDIVSRNVKAANLRYDMIKNKKILNWFKLLKYTNCYHSRKSIIMEPWIALFAK